LSFVADVGSFRAKTDEKVYQEGKWAEITVQGEELQDHAKNVSGTVMSLALNGVTYVTAAYNDFIFFRLPDNELHIGSHRSLIYFAYGLIYSFTYHNALDPYTSTARPWTDGHYRSPSMTNDTLCQWDQFYDGQMCMECHPSCENGCSDDTMCIECDEGCRSCKGPDSDQCS
jgi:hypothetical protein